MKGRKPDPNSSYHIILHTNNGYRYAATVETTYNEEKKRIRKYTQWGTVSLNNIFTPNLLYTMTPVTEREKLIFPAEWDISAATALNQAKHEGDAKEQNKKNGSDSGETDPPKQVEPIVMTPTTEYQNRLYGSVWFLLQIAQVKHVVEDLRIIFEYNEETVNMILTMAIFPYLTRRNFDRLAHCQDIYRFPAKTILTSSVITRFTQYLNDHHRMEFCKLRIERQPKGSYVACDSTTRTAWGECLADIHFGRNKDNSELSCTLEVVVYSLTTHEPVYYRTFPGNAPDARTLQSISDDMKELGAEKTIAIYDRGYESEDNFNELFMKDLPFISCAKVGQEPVINCLEMIQYDTEGLPINMEFDEEYQLFYAQFELTGREYPDKDGKLQKVAEHQFKCNTYMDPRQRWVDLQKINMAIKNESQQLDELSKTNKLIEKKDTVNHTLHYHTVVFTEKEQNGKKTTIAEIIANEKKIKKAKAVCGFFSSVTYKADGSAYDMLRIYKTRDEQEKYFEQMKDQMDFHTQDASSEDGKAGREFILFVGLILSSYVRNTWSRNLELRKKFKTTYEILDEMEKIRLSEYPDGTSKMSSFIGPQFDICKAYELDIPLECLSATDRKAEEQKQSPKKRGRKPKDTPPPHKVIPVQIGV